MRVTRWVAAAAVLVLVAGTAAGFLLRRHATAEKVAQSLAEDPDVEPTREGEAPGEAQIPDDDVHRRALAHDPQKSEWVDTIPGVDVSALSQQQLDAFLSSANTQRCTCGCGYTLAGCRVYDSSCQKSAKRVTALLDSVKTGRFRDAKGLRTRPAHTG